MPKLDTKGKLTIGELRDIASGKSKRKLTPEEKLQVKEFTKKMKTLFENFLPKNLPDLSHLIKSPDYLRAPILRDNTDYEARAEQKLLKKLLLEELKTKQQQSQVKNPVFDFAKSIIYFADKEIKISKGSNEHHVCRAAFSDPSKEWSWDEIVERWGEDPTMKNWRVIYNAAKQVNIKIAIETGIKDLLHVTTKTVCLNPTYIES